MSSMNSDDPEGASSVSPSQRVSVPQLDELVSDRDFNPVNVTPARTQGNVLNRQGGIPGVGRGAQLADLIAQSARASPVQTQLGDRSWSGQNPAGGDPLNQLHGITDLIKQLGSEIGSQISASLSQAGQAGANVNSNTLPNTAQNPDWSKMNLTLKSDIKEPPYFRGDSSDRFTLTEWQEMMQTYLTRTGCSLSEQGNEIMARLMGRARDVVKICTRNNRLLNITRDPDVIFTILREHFGDAISSTTPLQDFYETVPKHSESSLDYWIRLNKAIDLADECLRRQGRRVEDPSHEVTMMFLKHCPDPSLYTALRGKPLEKWTAGEVQEMIDSHHRDRQSARACKPQNIVRVNEEMTPNTCCMAQHPVVNTYQSTNAESASLSKMITLMEKILAMQEQSLNQTQAKVPANGPTATLNSCKICRAPDHSTKAHCFREGLCFKCFKTGHRGFECPGRKQVTTTNVVTSHVPDSALN